MCILVFYDVYLGIALKTMSDYHTTIYSYLNVSFYVILYVLSAVCVSIFIVAMPVLYVIRSVCIVRLCLQVVIISLHLDDVSFICMSRSLICCLKRQYL